MPTCYYCHKLGHLMVDCWTQKKRETKGINDRKPEGLVSSDKSFLKNSFRPHGETIREEYRPFMSDGYISPVGDPGKEIFVKYLSLETLEPLNP